MRDLKSVAETKDRPVRETMYGGTTGLPVWETPKIEDVSEQVMAQPYIRFT